MTKKHNTKKVNSVISEVENIAVKTDSISTPIPTAAETLQEAIARITNSMALMENRRNTLLTALNESMNYVKVISAREHLEQEAWNALTNSGMINVKYDDITKSMTAKMNELTSVFNDRQFIAVHVNARTTKTNRITVTGNSEVKINKDLIVDSILTYGCSFAKMPTEQQLKFNQSTRNRFNSIFGYFNQLQTNALNKNGYFAEIIRQGRLDDLTSPIHAMDANGRLLANPDGSPCLLISPDQTTRSRFTDALAIYQSRSN